MNTLSRDQIDGMILSGGRGTRMGHVDKGLQLLNDQPLIVHALRCLQPQVATVAINANRHQEQYRQFADAVWEDLTPDFGGPLAGLQSGLSRCGQDYLAVIPCDAPLLPADLVARLAQALCAADADAAIAVTGAGDGIENARQRHPVCCLLAKKLLPSLQTFLDSGQRKFDHWLASVHCVEVHFADERAFSNINTLQQLRALEA
ncbi:molybdenum cofactor guanylyltransferase [Herbaspirillum lusitanum]|uniref:Molybdenum cofactor guanylyltransferase n=1 Tax=Herbaspirillum lusitanum TaxID=213312 RepID=A0ABW9ACA6_9BURK